MTPFEPIFCSAVWPTTSFKPLFADYRCAPAFLPLVLETLAETDEQATRALQGPADEPPAADVAATPPATMPVAEETLLAAEARHAAEMADLRAAHAAELAAIRSVSADAVAAGLAEAIRQSEERLDRAIEDAVVPLLASLLQQRADTLAVTALGDALRAIVRDRDLRRIDLSGPVELTAAARSALAGVAASVTHIVADTPDMIVRLDDAALATRLGAWRSDIERIAHG